MIYEIGSVLIKGAFLATVVTTLLYFHDKITEQSLDKGFGVILFLFFAGAVLQTVGG